MDGCKWFVGVDWASATHHVWISDAQGSKVGERAFPHGGEGLAAMIAWILQLTSAPPENIAVAIEVPHGPVVETLMERGFYVYSINPKQLDRFRDRFSPAGAKDDSRDSHVLADALRTDPRCFRALSHMLDPTIVELREWSRMAEELHNERRRLSNRVRELLWRYYPQMLELNDDVGDDWFLELWQLVPTPEKARRVHESTLARFLRRHRIRRFTAVEMLERLRQPPLVVAPGVVSAATAHLKAVAKRLALVNQQIREAEEKLECLTDQLAGADDPLGQSDEQRDVTILRSLPGVGKIIIATLLAEASEALQRRDYHALRSLSGVAPITKRSGKSRIVLMRQAVHGRLRNAVYHWSRVAAIHDARSRAKYAALRARGHGHARALRSVADRLLAVACAMLENRTLFDPALADERALSHAKAAC